MKLSAGKGIFWGLGLALVVGDYFRKAKQELTTKNKALEKGLEEKNRDLEQANIALHEEIKERRLAEEQLTEMNRQLRDLSAKLHTIREEERTRIAREIHDVLGQQLTVIKLDLAWLSKRSREEEQDNKIKALLGTVDETIQTVKKIATELRPGVLDDLGLIAAIEWQCREFASRMGIHCEFITQLQELECNHEVSTAVFRILQETLTNIMRHAQASRVAITLRITGDVLSVEIADNGRGITETEISNGSSLGLLGMKERMHMIGGTLSISGTSEGTTVRLEIPLNETEGNGRCKDPYRR